MKIVYEYRKHVAYKILRVDVQLLAQCKTFIDRQGMYMYMSMYVWRRMTIKLFNRTQV